MSDGGWITFCVVVVVVELLFSLATVFIDVSFELIISLNRDGFSRELNNDLTWIDKYNHQILFSFLTLWIISRFLPFWLNGLQKKKSIQNNAAIRIDPNRTQTILE